jgi:hypothetical protein
MVAERRGRFGEQMRRVGGGERRGRIFALARSLERIAARPDLALMLPALPEMPHTYSNWSKWGSSSS